jgi:hypothetical protein
MENIHAKTKKDILTHLKTELQNVINSHGRTVTLTGDSYQQYGPQLRSMFSNGNNNYNKDDSHIHYFLTNRIIGSEFNIDTYLRNYLAPVDIRVGEKKSFSKGIEGLLQTA